jgi:hypothetical protein
MDPAAVHRLFEIERANTLKRKGIAVGEFVTFKKKRKRKKKKSSSSSSSTANNHASCDDDVEYTDDDSDGKVVVMIPVSDLGLDNRTVASLQSMADIKIRVAQDTTDARFTALMDPRLTYKVACGYKAWCRKTTAEYKWNADCTTIIVMPDGSAKLVCVVRAKGDKKKVESRFVVSDLNVLIKIFALGNAGGELGKLVAIVGVSSMEKDQFFKADIPGFTHSCERTPGTVYFSQTKSGCASMWRDVFLSFIIPEIKKSAEFHKHKVYVFFVLIFSTKNECMVMVCYQSCL